MPVIALMDVQGLGDAIELTPIRIVANAGCLPQRADKLMVLWCWWRFQGLGDATRLTPTYFIASTRPITQRNRHTSALWLYGSMALWLYGAGGDFNARAMP